MKPACKLGHEFAPANTFRTRQGTRVCKVCRYQRIKAWRLRNPDKVKVIYQDSYRLRKDNWEKAGVKCGTKGSFGTRSKLSVLEIPVSLTVNNTVL